MQEKRSASAITSNHHKNALNMNSTAAVPDKKLKSRVRMSQNAGSDSASASVCDKMSRESGNDSRNDSRNNSRNETPRFPDEYGTGDDGKSVDRVDTDEDVERCDESDNFVVVEGEVSVSTTTSTSSKKRCRLKHSSAISSQVIKPFSFG